ncbi:hypothetical protein PENSPDRAFT_680370 [Peniophora sp. CONT]|nr:hypothetical protein PENSPDRAFT_680370 [Peniophora sp. CONT]
MSSQDNAALAEDAPADAATTRSALDFVRDEHFYFRSAVFRAGKTHFRVPIYGLPSEDGIFAAMFALPNENEEGSSDDNPICLPPEVTAEDFRSLLKASIPMPAVSSLPKLTVDEWMSVLKLSTMWCLDGLRARAISAADEGVAAYAKKDRILDKILLAKQHRVSRWLIEGYEALGRRKTHLTPDERERLDLDTVFHSESKDHTPPDPWNRPARAARPMPATPEYRDRSGFDFISAIRSIFHDELSLDPDYTPAK